jgi:hypothetical protein
MKSPALISPPARFDRIVLIFNPASSRDSGGLAGQLCEELGRRLPAMPFSRQPTSFAGPGRHRRAK